MSTLTRPPAPVSPGPQPPEAESLRIALDAFSNDLTAELVKALQAQLRDAKPSDRMVEKAVARSVPALLQQAFFTSFLSGKSRARQHRAVLAQLLSAAEHQATVGMEGSPPFTAKETPEAATAAPGTQEVTSEAASKLLHVSRTHVNMLADTGQLGAVRRTEGGHRRIALAALLAYKAQSQRRQAAGLEAMMAASQALGLYDAEVADVPARARR